MCVLSVRYGLVCATQRYYPPGPLNLAEAGKGWRQCARAKKNGW